MLHYKGNPSKFQYIIDPTKMGNLMTPEKEMNILSGTTHRIHVWYICPHLP